MKNKNLPLLIGVFALFGSAQFYSQDSKNIINDYFYSQKRAEFLKSDLINFEINSTDASSSLKGDVVKIQQTYNGIPVYGSVGTALIKNGKITYFTDNFTKNYNLADAKNAQLSKNVAYNKIISSFGLTNETSYPILDFNQPETENTLVAKQRLVYVKNNANLSLAYEFILPEQKSAHYWNVLVDANSGEIIKKYDLNVACNFVPDAYSHESKVAINPLSTENLLKNSNDQKTTSSAFLAPDNASYNVFQFPIEAPSFGSRSLVSNPWILASSPEGWHSDGTTHYTITRGNNVYAYEDRDANNIAGTGSSPDGGASRLFDYSYSPNLTPINSLSAATTNLFYVSNKVHDIFYKLGFNAAARNFQQNNFGLGGNGSDYVIAESQDRSSFNNANFATPSDGSKPRMQMYLWSGSNQVLFYNAPSDAVSRTPAGATAEFGAQLDDVGVTGDVVLSPVLQACTDLPAGSLTGKIGLVERGTCAFTVKVKNAQTAGAKAVIIYNNVGGAVGGGMAGTDATITIPSILIENAEGEYIKTKLAASTTVNATLKLDIKHDGSFDNGIITHEYGHGISNRNTGDGYSCLYYPNSYEQMGEGWSDFFALMVTNQPGDNAGIARGMGTYVIGQGTTGGGIRPAKYTPDMTINTYTYGKTNGMEYNNGSAMVPHVHSIGFVWATILWDLHWKYVEKYGYSSDVTSNATNGSTRVLQLVIDALKLQECSPDFTTGRDAILAAEMATTGGEDRCMIWRTFAKRGVGLNASPGSKTDINDQVEDFSVPSDCLLGTNETTVNDGVSIYPNPAKNEFFIKLPSNTLGKLKVEIFDGSGRLVYTQDRISPDASKSISTQSLENGVYVVKVTGLGIEKSSKLMIKK